jgi:hypothetical protein
MPFHTYKMILKIKFDRRTQICSVIDTECDIEQFEFSCVDFMYANNIDGLRVLPATK